MSKCWYLMYELDPAHIEDCHYQYLYNMKIGKYFEQVPWIVTKEWIDYQEYKERNESMNMISNSNSNSNSNSTTMVTGTTNTTTNSIINVNNVSAARLATVDQNNRLRNISVVSAPTQATQVQASTSPPAHPISTRTITAAGMTQMTPFSTRLISMIHSKVNNPDYDNRFQQNINTLTNVNSASKVMTSSAMPIAEANDHEAIVTKNDNDGFASEGDIDLVDDTDDICRVSSMNQNSVPNAASSSSNNNDNNINNNNGSKHKNGNQVFRKTVVGLSGLLLFGFGLSILVSFVDFIENSYKAKCIPERSHVSSWDYFNSSDVSEFNKNNPEILVFYQEFDVNYEMCNQKTVNLFSYDYPSNC